MREERSDPGRDPADTSPVIVNAAAGPRRGRATARVRAAFPELEVHVLRPAAVEAALERAAAGSPELLVVAGGDGTQRTAAEISAGTATALLPLPIGTLNHFARRYGMPTLAEAGLALREGRMLSTPVGVLDDRLFLNTAIVGAYAAVVRRRDRLARWMPRSAAAALAFLAVALRARPAPVVLHADGERMEADVLMVWVGLGRGTYPLSRDAEGPRAPILEVAVLGSPGRRGRLRFLARLLFRTTGPGDPASDRAVRLFHARSLLLEADQAVGVTLDGEPMKRRPPLFIAAEADALLVRVPPVQRSE